VSVVVMLSLLSSSSDAMAMVSAPGARTFNMDTGNAVEVMLASAVVM
jgi:hypothetical protein